MQSFRTVKPEYSTEMQDKPSQDHSKMLVTELNTNTRSALTNTRTDLCHHPIRYASYYYIRRCTNIITIKIEGKSSQDHSIIVTLWLDISRSRLFLDMRFSRESRMCYVLSFSTIKTWGQWLRFQGKVEKPNFWQHFCNYWMNQIFPGKSGFVSRSAILSCNFMPSFGKILWLVFKKNSGQTDGRTDRGQSIGPTSFVGGSKK